VLYCFQLLVFESNLRHYTVDLTWYGNRERDIRNGFTVPPAYTMRQAMEAARRPAWSWDFLSNPEYTYAAVQERERQGLTLIHFSA
jgi:isopentenyl diphosphate isomerase/L-lactate dehydrogenase-like FMN-dependent dehydrogenase